MTTLAANVNPAAAKAALLQARLLELEAERDALARQKKRNLLFMGAAVSLLVHMGILLYLETVRRAGPPGDGLPASVFVEFSVMTDEELTNFEAAELEDAAGDLSNLDDLPEDSPDNDLDVTPPSADLEVRGGGSAPSLGGGGSGGFGAGGDGSGGIGGGSGGGGADFFGVSSTGQRFVFIVDISGSMTESNRFHTAMRELARSISELPDFAYFHVLLYESKIVFPPWQKGWNRARQREIDRLIEWVETVTPGGGTQPVAAFSMAFALDVPPDVVFFLTDGIIPEETADRVSAMNDRGKRVVINTIAFGDAGSQDMLRRIADESGGKYRFVPGSGG